MIGDPAEDQHARRDSDEHEQTHRTHRSPDHLFGRDAQPEADDLRELEVCHGVRDCPENRRKPPLAHDDDRQKDQRVDQIRNGQCATEWPAIRILGREHRATDRADGGDAHENADLLIGCTEVALEKRNQNRVSAETEHVDRHADEDLRAHADVAPELLDA
jgi:hypothetical protein